MNITNYSANKTEIVDTVKDLLQNSLGINEQDAEKIAQNEVSPHFDQLKDSIWVFIEFPYVDKVYRDSYYHYYASKSIPYKKDCIRISLFSEEISDADFRDPAKQQEIASKYRGFIVLRPTPPYVIGRNCISTQALKENDFLCCETLIPATANSLKFNVRGFPHSGQDTETITCAETSLWALMEYFGYKYAEYKPVLPSKIINILRNVSAERQIPSKGLNIPQMTFSLKEFGFGPRIYSKSEFKNSFFSLIATYVESGIPLIMAVQNSGPGPYIGHAMLCVGREKVSDYQIDNLQPHTELDPYIMQVLNNKNISLFDTSEIDFDFIFIDDNWPAYQKAKLGSPTSHYPSADWKSCEITIFVAPLYPKIYLEAYEAKTYLKQLLFSFFEPHLVHGSQITLRFFLTSSRSFKHSVVQNEGMSEEMKSFILETAMPKFIWVGEVSEKALLKTLKANGLFIIDATEANILDNKPLIFGAFSDKIVTFNHEQGALDEIDLPFPEFEIFTNYQGGF